MKPFSRNIFAVSAVALTLALLSYQNCSGTRTRTANLGMSVADVENRITQVQTQYTNDTSTTGQANLAAIQSVSSLHTQDGSTLYYAEAPGSMGPVDTVAPLDFVTLTSSQNNSPARVYIFMVEGGDGSIAFFTGAGLTALPSTPSASATASPAATAAVAAAAVATATASPTTTSSCNTTTAPLCLDFGFGGGASGSATAASAQTASSSVLSCDDTTCSFDLTINNQDIHFETQDITDGDLNDTVQFQVYSESGNGESYLGQLNLTQPN